MSSPSLTIPKTAENRQLSVEQQPKRHHRPVISLPFLANVNSNPNRIINSRLNAQYLPSYRFSYMSFELSIGRPNNIGDLEWPWTAKWPLFCVILPNLVMALILHYFIEFVYDVVVKQLLGLPWFQNLLLIVYDRINTICAYIQRLFR